MERYTTEVNGIAPCPPGTYQVFATEGGAAAMAYIFRSLQENHVIGHGDKVAIATPVFTPYLQIPTLEDFGLDVVELQAADGDDRTGDGFFDPLLDPDIKTDLPGEIDSVHAGHILIEKDEAERPTGDLCLPKPIEGTRRAVCTGVGDAPGSELLFEDRAVGGIIVHYKHPQSAQGVQDLRTGTLHARLLEKTGGEAKSGASS